MRRLDSAIFSAMRRRRPMTLTCRTSSRRAPATGRGAWRATRASRSAWTTWPPGPEPRISPRSIPSAAARRRTAGAARGDGGARRRLGRLLVGPAPLGLYLLVRLHRRGIDGGRRAVGLDVAHRLHRLGHLVGLLGLGLQLHQRRADRGHAAGLGGEAQHLAADRRGDLHRGLVGHHVDEGGVLLDHVADADVPGDDLGLGDPFADVRQLEDEAAHAPITFLIALATRAGPGKYSHSNACG